MPTTTVPLGAGSPVNDARLAGALRALEQGRVRVLSLDVFDTLVWRVVPEPVDAFVLLGRHLDDLGHLRAGVPPALFARLRVKAEQAARRRRPADNRPEVSLEAIYDELPDTLFRALPAGAAATLEVELERAITFPDLDVVHLAELAQSKFGARVALISDTYFSGSQLRRILDREPFYGMHPEAVLTSSDHGWGKADGLFTTLVERLGVDAGDVLHLGDNEVSDVAVPDRAGVRTFHYEKAPEPFRTVLERERVVHPQGHDRPWEAVDPLWGDFGLTALRSKALHRADGAATAEAVRPYWRSGATVLGPAFVGFAQWVHRRAQEEGVTTVHGVMREGELLARLVEGARRHLGSPVGARTISLSRQLCARAAILEASPEELRALLVRRRPPTVRQLCESLGIGGAELPTVVTDADGRLDDPELRESVLEAIAASPEARTAIVQGAARLRRRLVDYVLATVGPEATELVLVDLGWGATIQAHLQRAMGAAGVELEILGLYLLTSDAATDRLLEGVRAEGFLATGGFPGHAQWLTRSPEIIEQVCMHDSGSVVDIDAELRPVLAPARQSPVQMIQRAGVQQGILAFLAEWDRYAEVVPAERRVLEGRARDLLLRSLLRFVVSPTTEEATIFGAWLHDENYGSEASEPVVSADLARSLRYMTPEQLLDLPMTRIYWPFGVAALHHPALAREAGALAGGALGPEVGDAPECGVAEVGLDLGLGFGAGGGRQSMAIGRNGNGLSFLRAELWAHPLQGVRIMFPEGPGIVRLDTLMLTFRLRGRPDPVRIDMEWPEQFRKLVHHRCTALTENLFVGTHRAPAVSYRVPRDWEGTAYAVEVEACFAWLPTPPARRRPSEALDLVVEAGRKATTVSRTLLRAARQAIAERRLPS